MKERILNLLKNIHEAKELIEINDLLGLTSTAEYKELQDVMNELVEEYVVFLTKKGKYILLSAHREENIDTEKNFMVVWMIQHCAIWKPD